MELESLNNLTEAEAEARFLDCCGSKNWARKMARSRPFADIGGVIRAGENIWRGLLPEDRLEAFAAHPKIGAKKAAPVQAEQAAAWSKGEQAGMDAAADKVRDDLAQANRLYEDKFGYIFIVCASGKSATEMLEICRERLDNTAEAELKVAAGEQRKITEIRLRKLLND